MKIRLAVSKYSIFACLVTLVFAVLCSTYFHVIGDISNYPLDSLWSRPGNIHDHFVYTQYGTNVERSGFKFLDNNFGMYWLYSYTQDGEKQLFSHIANMLSIFVSAYAYYAICVHFRLRIFSFMTFFLNTSLIYYSILINKDAFTISIFLLSLLFSLKRRYFSLLLLIIPAVIVRQQLAYFVATLFITAFLLSFYGKQRPRMLALYSVGILSLTAIVVAIVMQSGKVMSIESLGSGWTSELISFSVDFPAFAFLTVIPRIILYINDMFLSFRFFDDGKIDAARILRIPAVIYIFYNAIFHLGIRSFYNSLNDRDFSIVVISAVCALSAILLNPQINARYITVVIPILILVITIYKSRRRWIRTE